jgi:dTDP-3-amino-2,3,6-trideoxy-4-keto-D-glucose/dTDP-3-amino-3,4,6-trideoxy-alpha-D-glucose/dTDP-2,6-dideoxy-D-kanosamine transaminase
MIKVWDYLQEYEEERDDILAAVDKVFRSGYLILGESVRQFEEAFSSYCGVSYGAGVNSGTDALFLALKALDIGPGDEVLTVSNTAVPTVAAIVSTGAMPRFADIDPNTYLMDVDQLESLINEKTKCILVVHLFGQCVDMEKINVVAQTHNLFVLEDCAQSHGAQQDGKTAGSMSTAAAISFYPTKILGTFGDGGMVITDDESLMQRLRRLRKYGMEKNYYSEEHGYNSRLDELHAEILLYKLTRLNLYIEKRRAIADRYHELLKNSSLLLPKTAPNNLHAYYLYVCRHPNRDLIIKKLAEHEILVNVSYPWPIHTMQGYDWLGYKDGDLPHTELAAKEIFSLPMYPTLSKDNQEYVCEVLLQILANL